MVEREQTVLAQLLKESIEQGSTPNITVISDSMSPLLRRGDQIGLRELSPAEAAAGQIITFLNQDENQPLVTHRIAGLVWEDGEEKIATFGDRSLLFDRPVAHEDVIGLVVWRRRRNHYIDLIGGRGAWLNNKLADRANKNLEKTSGLDLVSSTLDSGSLIRSNEITKQQRTKSGLRLFFLFNYLWAWLLTIYAGMLIRVGFET